MSTVVFVLGAPGAGKGTQCAKIVERYGWTHLSTGDLLRAEVAAETDLGKEAADIMKAGQMVPTSMVLDLISKAIKTSGGTKFLVDGFPRTLDQLQDFEAKVQACDGVLVFTIPDDVAVSRLVARGESSGRADDNEETIMARLSVFKSESQPVIDALQESGRVAQIDAQDTPDDVFESVVSFMELMEEKAATKSESKPGAEDEEAPAVTDTEGEFPPAPEDEAGDTSEGEAEATPAADDEASPSETEAEVTVPKGEDEFPAADAGSASVEGEGETPAAEEGAAPPAEAAPADEGEGFALLSEDDAPPAEAEADAFPAEADGEAPPTMEELSRLLMPPGSAPGSRPASQAGPPGSAPGSSPMSHATPPGSAPGSRPMSQATPPGSAPGSRPASQAGPPGSAPGSRPMSQAGPPGSAPGSRPMSQVGPPPGSAGGAKPRTPPPGTPEGVSLVMEYDEEQMKAIVKIQAAGRGMIDRKKVASMTGEHNGDARPASQAAPPPGSAGGMGSRPISQAGKPLTPPAALSSSRPASQAGKPLTPPASAGTRAMTPPVGARTPPPGTPEERVSLDLTYGENEIKAVIKIQAAGRGMLDRRRTQSIRGATPPLAAASPPGTAGGSKPTTPLAGGMSSRPASQAGPPPASAPRVPTPPTAVAAPEPFPEPPAAPPPVAARPVSGMKSEPRPVSTKPLTPPKSSQHPPPSVKGVAPAPVTAKALPVRQYMDQTVVPILREALRALNDKRPGDPLLFLSDYLLQAREKRLSSTGKP